MCLSGPGCLVMGKFTLDGLVPPAPDRCLYTCARHVINLKRCIKRCSLIFCQPQVGHNFDYKPKGLAFITRLLQGVKGILAKRDYLFSPSKEFHLFYIMIFHGFSFLRKTIIFVLFFFNWSWMSFLTAFNCVENINWGQHQNIITTAESHICTSILSFQEK